MEETKTTFKEIWDTLSKISVKGHTKEKESDHGKTLSYLPWAVAWRMLIEVYPNSTYTIHENENSFPCFYNDLGGICKTTVEIEGHKRSMTLPVMDYANKAMKPDTYTYSTKKGEKSVNPLNTFEINKTNFRCLVKNLAMFGLGIDIYIGDDLTLTPDETENAVPWEVLREQPIGRGKNQDIPWSKLPHNSLAFYTDKEANAHYSEWYATRAQNELDFRYNKPKTMDEHLDDSISKSKSKIDEELEKIRDDVQAQADRILKNKYGKPIQYPFFCEKIQDATDKETLLIINARIQAIDTLASTWRKEKIDNDRYLKDLKIIVNASNGQLDNLVNALHKLDPEGTENRDYLNHYQKTIEKQFQALGYDQNPSLATNSMKKHLNTDDMYTIEDWEKLKTYSNYLTEKMFGKENTPNKKAKESVKLEANDDGGVPFPPKEEKKSPVDPNYKAEDIDLG